MSEVGRSRVSIYFSHHVYALNEAWHYILKTPLSSFMTAVVISLALVLPAILWTMLLNLETLTKQWDQGTQLTLYLKKNIPDSQMNILAEELRKRSTIADVKIISSAQALEEFEKQTGIPGILKALNENPLPPVIEIHPALSLVSSEQVQTLLTELQKIPDVESVSIDMAWVKKLYGFIHLGKRAVAVLAILLGVGGMLITANTLRMLMTHARQQIEIVAHRGGTRAFLRRPFLYVGFFYGLVGSALAGLILSLIVFYLAMPVHSLALLYQSHFTLEGLDVSSRVFLFVGGITLNLMMAWLVFSRMFRVFA